MTEKVRLEIEDGTSPGIQSVEKNLDGVSQSANEAEKQLNQAAQAADRLGDEGKKSTEKAGIGVTELNQGLELLKKGVELASRAITALAADGNPAFVKLESSITEVQNALLDIANDPGIQQWTETIAQGITDQVVPAINSLPDYWRGAQDAIADFTASAGESIGLFADGTVEALQDIQVEEAKLLEKQKEQLEIQRQREAVEGKIGEVTKLVAAQDELQQLAQIKNLNEVLYLIDDETERLRVLAKEGRATREEQAESIRKIALLKKRELEIPREQADAEKRAMEETAKAAEKLYNDRIKAADDAADAEMKYRAELEKAAAAVADANAKRIQEMIDKAVKARNDLAALIEKAQGSDGKNLLEGARQQISPEQVRAELVRRAQQEARANLQPVGDDARTFAAQRDAAAKQAGIKAFRDFNAGNTSQADIVGAQNTLIQQAAQTAQGRGQLDQQTAQTLTQALQNQQQMAAQQEQQANQLKQIQAAFTQVGNSTRNLNAASRRAGL